MWKDDLVTSIVASKKLAEIQTNIRETGLRVEDWAWKKQWWSKKEEARKRGQNTNK